MKDNIFNKIANLLNKKEQVIVAIDGRSGAGKTTLAKKIKDKINCNVFSIDDFFLPATKRQIDWQNTAGGNIDILRFKREILDNIIKRQAFNYLPFNCRTQGFNQQISVQPKRLNIIEGSYCLLPEFSNYYHFKIFINIDKQTQKMRIIERNGIESFKNFENTWIPLEEKYYKKYNILNICDVILNGNDF